MPKCNLCDKIFPSESKLLAHKNRKNPCNSIKQSMECNLCNIKFEHKSHLERHNKTKKHINNYNIQIANNITNNLTPSTISLLNTINCLSNNLLL
jgi:hypothetical protein